MKVAIALLIVIIVALALSQSAQPPSVQYDDTPCQQARINFFPSVFKEDIRVDPDGRAMCQLRKCDAFSNGECKWFDMWVNGKPVQAGVK